MILISILMNYHPCFSQEKIRSGKAVLKTQLYDAMNHRYYSNESVYPNTNIWFKDNLIIENLKFINNTINKDIAKNEGAKSLCYVFIDLKNKKRSIYQHFSDTASPYKVPNYDNDRLEINIWSSGDSTLNDSPVRMPDTTINSILYRRLKFHWGQPGKKETWVAYARCDKIYGVFDLSKWASDRLGCPVVMLEGPSISENPVSYRNVIEIVSEKLDANELKVFEAWERNSTTHSTKKN